MLDPNKAYSFSFIAIRRSVATVSPSNSLAWALARGHRTTASVSAARSCCPTEELFHVYWLGFQRKKFPHQTTKESVSQRPAQVGK